MMKSVKRIAVACLLFIVAVSVINCSYAISASNLSNAVTGGTSSNEITGVAKDIWATVAIIIQILAVAAVVFAGLRYMFASADAKADIKKQTVILIVGAVLVFGATAILQLVSNTTNNIVN